LCGGENESPNPIISSSLNYSLPSYYYPLLTIAPFVDLNPTLISCPKGVFLG